MLFGVYGVVVNRQRVVRAVLPSAVVAGLVVAGGAVVVATTGGDATATATGRQISATEAAATTSYWTPARMKAATPLGVTASAARSRSAARVATAPSGWKTGTYFHGLPSLGALFLHNGTGDHYCTASVIDSSKKNLLITAAHCIHGGKGSGYATNVAFVPKYDAKTMPYGMWTAKLLVVPSGWQRSTDPDLDFGFIAIRPRPSDGKQIAQVVGNNTLVKDKGFTNSVYVDGYPDIRYEAADHPIYCRNTTKKQSTYQMRFDCDGYTNGTSGSPWLMNYNPKTRVGQVVGVLGGYQKGGNVSWISYAAYFDKDVWNLRAAANQQA